MTTKTLRKKPVTAKSLNIKKVVRSIVNRNIISSSAHIGSTARVSVSVPAVKFLDEAA